MERRKCEKEGGWKEKRVNTVDRGEEGKTERGKGRRKEKGRREKMTKEEREKEGNVRGK